MGAGPDRLPAYPLMSLGTLKGSIMFKVEFATDNAAFEGEARRDECARILREIADKLENGSQDEAKVYDQNGNAVGRWSLSEIDED